jgi:hypothetical protein
MFLGATLDRNSGVVGSGHNPLMYCILAHTVGVLTLSPVAEQGRSTRFQLLPLLQRASKRQGFYFVLATEIRETC